MPDTFRRTRSTLVVLIMLSLLLPGVVALPQPALAAGTLVGRWTFEEGSGSTAADSSGNGRTGLLSGTPSWVAGGPGYSVSNYALGFAANQGVEVANSGAFDLTSLSVSSWIYPEWDAGSLNYSPAVFSVRDPDAGVNTERWVMLLSSDYSSIAMYNGDITSNIAVNIPARQWTHVAVVFSSASDWSLYLNGALAGSASGVAMNTAASGRPFNIGFSGTRETFIGAMDDVRFYSGALTAAEVAPLAQTCASPTITVGASNLREAIANSCDGGTVNFSADITVGLANNLGHLAIDKSLTIDGTGHSININGSSVASTSIDGGIFAIGAGTTVKLKHLNLTSGGARNGGAIYNLGTLTVEDVSITNSTAASDYYGGAIYNDGTLTVSSSTISNNSTGSVGLGGGIYNFSGRTATISGSLIQNNSSPYGAGIYNRGTLTISDSTFTSNIAAQDGGAIRHNGGTLLVTRSTFANNRANGQYGGGIYSSSTATVANSTFSGNQASEGGAIANLNGNGGSLTLINTTLSGNTATTANRGGALLNSGLEQVFMTNTILANSTAGGDCKNIGTLVTNAKNLVEDGSCPSALSGDPALSALGSYGGSTQTFALLPGSKAIDAGASATCAASPAGGVDQRGISRSVGSSCDIGAFESGGFSMAITGGNNQKTLIGTGFPSALAVQIAAKSAGEPVGPGGVVTFTAPGSGASLSSTPQTASTTGAGAASLSSTANGITGGYSVSASASGVDTPASFGLTNCAPSTVVVTSGADSGAGSLRQAIDAGCAGDTITFNDNYTIYLNSTLTLARKLTIDATGRSVVVSGDSGNDGSRNVRPFDISATASVTLTNMTVVSGTASFGGGIYNLGTLRIENGTLRDNVTTTNDGGAIRNDGTLTIASSTLSGNRAGFYGGAIMNVGGATLTLSGSTLSGNSAQRSGGALYNLGTATIAGSTLSGNTLSGGSSSLGGAISNIGTTTISGSTLSGNSGASGGAIYTNGTTTVDSSTLSGNSGSWGGVFQVNNGTLTVSNSTISGNSASIVGGVIYILGVFGGGTGVITLANTTMSGNTSSNTGGLYIGSGTLHMRNSIIANSGRSCTINGAFPTNSANLVEDGGCAAAYSGDPLLAPLGSYGGGTMTHALLPGSKAIDAGDGAACSASPISGLDQRGVTRSVGASCDLGAFESGGFTLADGGGNSQLTEINSPFETPLTVQVTANSAEEPVGPGGIVTFTAPGSGASLSNTPQTATTDAEGGASLSASANGIAGTYSVSASTTGATSPISFSLANRLLYNLSVDKSGSGTVTSSPDGINCGATCSTRLAAGTNVTLTASAATGSSFAGWGGDCSGNSPSCQVTMSQARSVTATFTLNQYALNLSVTGSGAGMVSSSPSGISCSTACSASFSYGTVVTLTASAATGSSFAGWGGDCSGTGSCVVTVSQAQSVTANFTLNSYALTVTKIGSGGSISSSPAGIACGATCAASFAYGTVVTLTASVADGSTFQGWEGACSGSSPTCVITMDQDRGVTASFTLGQLSLSFAGKGSGSVSSSPAGIACSAACSATFGLGTVVTLTATAATGSTFQSWDGACTGSSSTCVVTVDQDSRVTALFKLNSQSLGIGVVGSGIVSGSHAGGGFGCPGCSAGLPYGTVVTLTGNPASGWSFDHWEGDCAGATCVLTMTQNYSVTAYFTRTNPQLSVSLTSSGQNSLSSSPAGINCGIAIIPGSCSALFASGTTVTLTAHPAAGYLLTAWTDACSGTSLTCTVTMDQNRHVGAQFSPAQAIVFLPLISGS